MLSAEQLKKILPQATSANIAMYLPFLNDLLPKFGIDNNLRIAAFLAQVGHESGQLRYNKEIWGPTAAQKGYEGRKDLGNVISGDGTKFKGRGLIQITGRANYSSFAQANGVDCINNPALLEQPEYAVMTACWFWQSKKLNQFADSGDFKTLTKRINGGYNGFEDRVQFWERAKKILK
jgi:putative chitinase